MRDRVLDRRSFLSVAAGVPAGLLLAGCGEPTVGPRGAETSLAEPAAAEAAAVAKHSDRVGLAFDRRFLDHLTPPGHPERPARLTAIGDALAKHDLLDRLETIPAHEASDAVLLRCHTQGYLDIVKRDIAAGRAMLSTGGTPLSDQSKQIARLAVGGIITAVDRVCTGKLDRAFCAVRPPGHHATATRGMGFCIFSNAALAARHAQRKHGIGKVLIVDWDVHHGNGTQDILYNDGSVFFFSTHQSPLYPGTGDRAETGDGAGKGTTMNRPFPAGAGRAEVLGAFERDLLPAMRTFKPELVIISAGFDSREGDPLGGFKLQDKDFADLTRMMRSLADDTADGRVISVLEGGYNLEGLASACTAHVKALLEPGT